MTWTVLASGIAGIVRVPAAHAQVTVAVSAPASVPARTAVLVRVEVTAPATASVRLAPPSFAPFHLVRTDRAPTDTAGLGGRQRLDWRFVLRTDGAGTFAFDPFEVDVQGAGLRPGTYRSRAWSVAVLPPASPTWTSAPVPAAAHADLAGVDPSRLEFDARVLPERVYVGQQATLELRVGIGTRVRERLRRSPEFAFPTVSGVVTYDLSARHASTLAGDVHVYRRALFPLAAGPVEVPAAQLAYALTPEGDPFGTEERIAARSSVRRIVAVPPPTAGRPAEWDGAVGRYEASARVDTAHARVGDAVVYTLRLAGTGNAMLLPRPSLTLPWADVSAAGERVTVDSTGDLAGGAKEFDWLLTPRAAGTQRIPALRYVYFDPNAATYASTAASAIDLRVGAGTLAAAPPPITARARNEASPRTGLGVRRTPDAERGPVLVERRGFWFALAAVPAPGALWLLASATIGRWRTRRSRRGAPAVLPTADARARATAALSEFTVGLGTLIGSPPSAASDARTLVRTLRRAGLSRALTTECERAVERWRGLAYGGEGTPADAAHIAPIPHVLLERIRGEIADARAHAADTDDDAQRGGERAQHRARSRMPGHAWAGVAIGAAVLAIAVAAPGLTRAHSRDHATPERAGDRAHAASAFAAGVAAYAAGDAARARDLFVAAADAAPELPSTWLNAGTAAWAVGDTATAAFAWQRAAHLAPTLAGIRARLDRLPAVAAPGRIGAPPVADATLTAGLTLGVAAAAALWMLAAAVTYTRAARATSDPRVLTWRGPLVAYVASVALAGGAALAARAMDMRGLAVVRAPVGLRPEPVSEAPLAGAVATGEVARIEADEGGWVRVRLDGDREGWVRSAQLAPLDGSP